MSSPLSILVERVPVRLYSATSEERSAMGFRLIYEGELLSAQSGDKKKLKKNKHDIRKQLHIQLKQLWAMHPMLRTVATHPIPFAEDSTPPSGENGMARLARNFQRGGYEFVPLISTKFQLICSLDILFLRREPPGALVQGGDIDNRLKTLFDSLSLPQGAENIPEPPTEDEKPFHCLLEDDRLVTEVNVTTDRLLCPPKRDCDHAISDVTLVIAVELTQTLRLW